MKQLEKEIALCESKFDYALQFGCSEVFMESEGTDKVKQVFTKIKDAIQKFFSDLKAAIDKKVIEVKRKKSLDQLDALWKKNINNVVTIKGYAEPEKVKKLAKEMVSLSTKTEKKLLSIMGSNKSDRDKQTEIALAKGEFSAEFNKLNKKIIDLQEDYRFKLSKNGVNVALQYTDVDVICENATRAIADLDALSTKFYQQDVSDAVKSAAAAASEEVARKTAETSRKLGSVLSKNKYKILAVIGAATVAAGGVLAGKKVAEKNKE